MILSSFGATFSVRRRRQSSTDLCTRDVLGLVRSGWALNFLLFCSFGRSAARLRDGTVVPIDRAGGWVSIGVAFTAATAKLASRFSVYPGSRP